MARVTQKPVEKAAVLAAAFCSVLALGGLIGLASTGVPFSKDRVVGVAVDAALKWPGAFLGLWALIAWRERRRLPKADPTPTSVHVDTGQPPADPRLQAPPHQGPPYTAARPRRPIGSVVVDCPECGGTTPARTEPGEALGARCKHCGARFLGLTRLVDPV